MTEGRTTKEAMPLDEYMCHIYILKQMRLKEQAQKAKEEKEAKKQKAYKKEVLSKVFGDTYNPKIVKEEDDPEKGITLKQRPDKTETKVKTK